MLIHKRTMGVLDLYWTGEYRTAPDGVAEPVMREYGPDPAGFPWDEWWYVPRASALGRRVRRCYPYCVPVTGPDGSLTDVAELPRRDGEDPRPRKAPPGGRHRQRRRQTGLLEHILEEGEEL